MLVDRSDKVGWERSPIGVAFPASTELSAIEKFASEFEQLDVNVDTHSVPDGMQYRAGVEWLMPTLVIVYIAKSYFEGMLEAAGAEHYKILKDASSKLLNRFRRIRQIELRPTPPNRPPSPYTRAISMIYSGSNLESFKLLFPIDAEETQIARSISFFTKFAEADSQNKPVEDWAILYPEISNGFPGLTRLLAFDEGRGKLVEIDPIPPEVRNR